MDSSLMTGHKKRLKDRYKNLGINSLNDYEVIELLLRYVIIRKDCKIIAKKLLAKFKTISNVLCAQKSELLEVEGIGENIYYFFKFIKDIESFYIKENLNKSVILNDISKVIDYLRVIFSNEYEAFFIIYLNSNMELINCEELFKGCSDHVYIYKKQLIEKILLKKATNVIISHNHTNENIAPSKDDVKFTNELKDILNYLDIKLLDHIIISKKKKYFSFRENKLL